MGSKLSTTRGNVGGSAAETAMKKKEEELILVDTLLEEGLNDGDAQHLCLDKTLLVNSGHGDFKSKDLEDVLAIVRKKGIKPKKLSVMFNGTGGQGIGEFIEKDEFVREVTVLCEKLSDNSVDSLAKALLTNRTVTKVLLGGNELQGHAAGEFGMALKATHSLEHLTFFNCGFRDLGAELIASGLSVNTTLRRLDLPYCIVGEDGATAISRAVCSHPTLSHLNLKNNQIGARGSVALAHALKGNCVLVELILGTNRVGNSGAIALANVLPFNTSLACLDLEANGVGDEGGRAFAEGLEQNATLRQLNLRKNNMARHTCESVRYGWNKRNAKRGTQLGQPWHDGLSLTF